MTDNLKKRVPNFSTSETELLTTLVKRYSNVLENKKTDLVNNQLKEETWCKLTEDFNSASGLYQRNKKTLRAKYENMKKSLKRKYGEHRRSLYRTGGGPPQDLHLTQEEEIIMDLAGPSVEGLPARFDCDTIPDCEENTTAQVSQVIAEVLQQPETHHVTDGCKMEIYGKSEDKFRDAEPDVVASSTPHRFLLKRKMSTPLTRRNPESFNNTMFKYSELSLKKQALIDAQIRSVEERTKQEKIEHEFKCVQLEQKAKQEAREHELRCELLMLEIIHKKKSQNNNKFYK